MKYKIPISKPYLTNKDFNELKKCFDSSWISSKSPWVEKFETLFAKNVSQTRYAVAVNSGTSAIFLALKSLGIGLGDQVILPTFTMIATINAISLAGGNPILVDSQSKDNWNISIKEIERKITKKTKAIIPVHIYGYPCNMNKIMSLSRKYNLSVIEDAAEAMGSVFKGKNCGSFGHLSCFSLYSNKIITTGNGGIVATNSIKLYHLIKQLSFFDFNPRQHFLHYKIGYNFALSGLQASLGVSQIDQFDKLLKKRRQIYQWYQQYLNINREIRFINTEDNTNPNYWFPAIIFKQSERMKRVCKLLEINKIETRKFFLPLHQQPPYKKMFEKLSYPNARYFYEHGLLLPSYYELSKLQIIYVCGLINSIK